MKAALERDQDTGRWWLTFPSKPSAAEIAALKAGGWRWGGYRRAWYNASRFAKVPEGIEYEEGGLVEYAAERAERLEERAAKAEAQSTAVFARVHALADSIPLGQPILVGHHSERHARRDAERIHSGMSKACALSRKAERLEQAAAGSASAQAHRHDPGAIARRVEKMEKELRLFERRLGEPRNEGGTAWALELRHGRKPTPEEVAAAIDDYRAETERCAAITREDLARAREELAAAGGLAADQLEVKVGDVVRVKTWIARVVRVNPKTLSCAVLLNGAFESPRWPLKYDKSFLKAVLGRYCAACDGNAKRDGACTVCGGKGFTMNAKEAA